jgi:hypothetical protein
VRLIPAIHGYAGAVTLLWHAGRSHTSIIEQTADENSVIGPLRLSHDHKDWQSIRVLQLLLGHEDVAVVEADAAKPSRGDVPETGRGHHGALSPILERITRGLG